ncbi:MAG: zinc-dependent peptidase [Bacteroidales bacterium]|nr:zinc-dependent peptidase [Bacteroidales bacterium]
MQVIKNNTIFVNVVFAFVLLEDKPKFNSAVFALFLAIILTIWVIIARRHLKFNAAHPKEVYSKLKPVHPKDLEFIKSVLLKTNFFFASLDEINQKKFAVRVMHFIRSKKWVGIRGFQITPENKVQIAASAIMISFGLSSFVLSRFRQIIVSPDSSFIEDEQKFADGLVNKKGYIYLSWQSFEEGFSNSTDGINLGIHEMAHAVDFSGLIFPDRGYILTKMMDSYLEDMKNQLNGFSEEELLRPYSKTDIKEFFAVAVESFFERPVIMKEKTPGLYEFLKEHLKMDTASILRAV